MVLVNVILKKILYNEIWQHLTDRCNLMNQYFLVDSTKLYQYKEKRAIQICNVGQRILTKSLTKMSESTLQLNLKKLSAAKYWYNTKAEYLWLFEKVFVIPFPFPPSVYLLGRFCSFVNTFWKQTLQQIEHKGRYKNPDVFY